MAVLYGRAGHLTAKNGGFWPGQAKYFPAARARYVRLSATVPAGKSWKVSAVTFHQESLKYDTCDKKPWHSTEALCKTSNKWHPTCPGAGAALCNDPETNVAYVMGEFRASEFIDTVDIPADQVFVVGDTTAKFTPQTETCPPSVAGPALPCQRSITLQLRNPGCADSDNACNTRTIEGVTVTETSSSNPGVFYVQWASSYAADNDAAWSLGPAWRAASCTTKVPPARAHRSHHAPRRAPLASRAIVGGQALTGRARRPSPSPGSCRRRARSRPPGRGACRAVPPRRTTARTPRRAAAPAHSPTTPASMRGQGS